MPLIDPDLLLRGYAIGVFPMSDGRTAPDVYWVEPKRRAILPLDNFRLSRSLRKVLRSGRFTVTRDRAFAQVVACCAERAETWINPLIETSYADLHARGHAHSVEVWQDEALVGGLYGVRLGGAFFGESMFSAATDASKVALAWLVARLRAGGFSLLDCQFMTDHLASLGAVEISQTRYLELLAGALDGLGALSLPVGLRGAGAGVGEALGRSARRGAGRATDAFEALEALLAAAGVSPEDAAASGCVISQFLTQTS
jgi:leucyl/phenylalanyl-tRNA--protein transferase